MNRSERVFRTVLVTGGGIAAIWGLGLGASALLQWRTLGTTSGIALLGLVFGLGAAALTPAALGRSLRFGAAEEPPPFHTRATYWRLGALLALVFFLAVVFGSRSEMWHRLGVHMLGWMLLHRAALCTPALVSRIVRTVERNPVLHALDLVATNVLVALVAAELVLRAAFLVRGDALPWLYDKPSFWDRKIDFEAFGVEPNSLGYNDREFAVDKGEALRIATVGDSFFVAAVPRHYGVIRQMDDELARLRPGAPPEVYNFAIMATAPWDYLEILRQEALGFDPDVVVLGIYVGNDIKKPAQVHPLEKRSFALYRLLASVARLQQARSVAARGDFLDITTIERTDEEYWYGGLVPNLWPRDIYLGNAANFLELCLPNPGAHREEEWRSTLQAIAETRGLVEATGARFYVVISPDHVQISQELRDEIASTFGVGLAPFDLEYPQRRLMDFCAESGLECLDLLPTFQAEGDRSGDPDSLYLPSDNHWSAQGNWLAGRAIAEWLEPRLPVRSTSDDGRE